jgi:hypothetical protein
MENNNDALSKEQYEQIKQKLTELEKQYKEKIEQLAIVTNELADIKYKINICFDLINSYYSEEVTTK